MPRVDSIEVSSLSPIAACTAKDSAGHEWKLTGEQAELVSRCRMTFEMTGHGALARVNQSILDRALLLEAPSERRQGRLDLEHAKLSEGFFAALQKHPIPLQEAAIRALANNSAAIDVYLWLAYRLHALRAPRPVSWLALKAQHGAGYKTMFHFRSKFLPTLRLALAVYPDAKVDVEDDGITLRPSPPPVPPRVVTIKGLAFTGT